MFSYGSYGSKGSSYNSLYSGGWEDYLESGSGSTNPPSSASTYGSYISSYANKFGNLGQGQQKLLGMVGDSFSVIQEVMEMEQQIYQLAYQYMLQEENKKNKKNNPNKPNNPSGGNPTASGNTVDVNGDGTADVVVEGEGAEQLAARIKEITENHPEVAELLLQGAKQDLSKDGMYHIEIKDLGGNIAGLAEVGQKGEGTMGFGHMWIDDQWQNIDAEQFAEILVHELGHNAGFDHGGAHDQWIQGVLH